MTLLQLYLYCMRISSVHPLSSQYRHVYINLAPQKPLQLNPAVRHRNVHKTNSILSRLFNFNHFPTSTKILLKNIMKYHQSSNRPEQKKHQPTQHLNQPTQLLQVYFFVGYLGHLWMKIHRIKALKTISQ